MPPAVRTVAAMYVAAPNCPNCLRALVVEGSTNHPYWWCDHCELVVLDAVAKADAD